MALLRQPNRAVLIVAAVLLALAAIGQPDRVAANDPTNCDFVDGVERVTAATAQVVMSDGAGTAFYIGNDEWVTAAHVVEGGGSIRLRTEAFDREASLVGRDVAADLAVLRASGTGLTALTFGDHAGLRLGETLGVAGYPMTVRGSPSVASGLLSKFLSLDGIAYIQTSAEVSPGNSGGPLFTECGLIVGVIVLKQVHEAIEGIAWAVALPTMLDRLPQLRGDRDVTPSGGAALTITAICNRQWDGERWQRPQTSAACRAAAEGGLHTGEGWRWIAAVRGVEDWANVAYRFDGGPSVSGRERWVAFDALAPGLHTIEVRERRAGVWQAWSAPYAFTIRGTEDLAAPSITAVCNQWWDATTETWQKPETADACRTEGAIGLRTGSEWHWAGAVSGVEDWANVVYRFDGGPAFSIGSDENGALFDALIPGQHTIEVRELRGGVWTPWSAPYTFTISVPPRPPTITAFCNTQWDLALGKWQEPDTEEGCRAAGVNGLRTGEHWGPRAWYRGLEDVSNPREVRFDGGVPSRTHTGAGRAAFDALGPGVHTIEVRERQSRGWTAWSAPYTFTIREPRDPTPPRINSICNLRWDGEQWRGPSTDGACRAADGGRLHAARGWWWTGWLWNVRNFDNVAYRFDAGAPFRHGTSEDFEAFYALDPGPHTIEVRERRNGGWTVWSAPFNFTVRSTRALRITAFCNYQRVGEQWYRYPSAEACKASAVAGLHGGESWDIWITGVENLANVRYSIDGGPAAPEQGTSLHNLAPGEHSIEVREQRGGQWTAWSAAYTFTIRAPGATLAPWIAGVCNARWVAGVGWQWPDSAEACEVAGAAGLRTGPGRHWYPVVGGVVDWDRLVYRFDGGTPFRFASVEDFAAFRILTPGQHTIEVRERRDGVWTAWSAPFTFTTRRR